MATRIRLARTGGKKRASFRIVAADGGAPRDGRFLEILGHYNPAEGIGKATCHSERIKWWLDRGAQPSDTVRHILKATS